MQEITNLLPGSYNPYHMGHLERYEMAVEKFPLVGIIMTLPNPLTIIFWASAISSLTIGYDAFILCATILIVGSTWCVLEAGLIHFARQFINNKILRVIEFIASLIILGFAIKFLVQLFEIIAN